MRLEAWCCCYNWRVTFWQRFLARPPLRAWAVGLVPALSVVLIVVVASDNGWIHFGGALVGSTVMHAVAAAVWPRLSEGNR